MKDELKRLMELFKVECKTAGLVVGITRVDATPGEQAALYTQGRYDLATVNRYREAAKMVPIAEAQNKVVTQTLNSRHLHGEAFDIVLGAERHYNLKVDSNANGKKDYAEAAEIGRRIGLVPGIDFGDAPHYQLKR